MTILNFPARTRSRLRLGTRGSQLATTQSSWVAGQLTSPEHTVELTAIATLGDRSEAPIEQLGGTGVFVTALRTALLRGEVDVIVHSYKDLPAAPEPGIRLAAIPVREDPRDALICRTADDLADLPDGALIGTGSPRRCAQLLAKGLPLRFAPLRGNVDTRLAKLADGAVDALILARAGLARLGRLDVITSILDTDLMLPAPAQGALAVECRADDDETAAVLSAVDDPITRTEVAAERAFLATLNGGCTAPVGALATLAGSMLRLDACVAAPDGSELLRRNASAPATDAERLGRDLALALIQDGATELLDLPAPAAVDPRTAPNAKGARR
jgi:hydroxymethylbilane synthase